MAYPPDFGEDELKWKFQRCVNDLALKTVAATTLSYLGAKMFLSRKHTKNAVMCGVGAAMGLAYYTCEKEFQHSMRLCKDGVDKVIVCEECKKHLEERRKQRSKEQDERKKKIEKQMKEEGSIPAVA